MVAPIGHRQHREARLERIELFDDSREVSVGNAFKITPLRG
jgi:hypothetical protein